AIADERSTGEPLLLIISENSNPISSSIVRNDEVSPFDGVAPIQQFSIAQLL
uniref:ER lumen protein-retaining receptor n=1 Tax=Parascaris univalens TaxID=6257 RepID=A0A915BNR6_PARUN